MRLCCVICFVWVGTLASALLAQSPTGTITGTVSDTSRGVVPNAKVEITNVGTGISLTRPTNSLGYFEFPLLSPGTYRLGVEATGFRKYVRDDIALNVGEKPSLQVVLEPGKVTETVEVKASAPLLEAQTSDVGQVVNRRAIENLPLNGRSVISLQLLSNGVVPINGVNNGPGTIYATYINGGRQDASEVLYDGIADTYAENNPGLKDLARDPPLASVEEVKLMTNSMSAEYGGTTGGTLTIVSRSGTNAFHGEAFEFLRNDALNASDFFSNLAGSKKQPTKKNQFGFALGGPIRHDKTFFFFHYEGDRGHTIDNRLTTVPTALMRQGNFSELLPNTPIYSPFALTAPYDVLAQQDPRYSRYTYKGGNAACAAAVPDSGDGKVRPVFPGNIIPAQCLDPVGLNVVQFYPLPNLPGLINNFFSGGIATTSFDRWDVKLDHNTSERNRFFFRFGRDVGSIINANHFKNFADPTYNPETFHTHQAVFEDNFSISPTTLLTLRYGLTRVLPRATTDARLKDFTLAQLGFPGWLSDIAAKTQPHYFPNFYIGGFSNVGTGGWAGYRNAAETHTLSAALTLMRGRHSIKTGYMTNLHRDNEVLPGLPAGVYANFGPEYTSGPTAWAGGGSALADFLIGGTEWNSMTVDFDNATHSWYHAGFVQDDFKVNSKLTLNVGLRYEVNISRTERHNRQSFWRGNVDSPLQLDPAVVSKLESQLGQKLPNLEHLTGGLGFPGVGGFSPHLYQTDWNNLGPRFGFAYSPTPKTVLRGAFGIIYGPTVKMASGNGARTQDGFAYTLGVTGQSTFFGPKGQQEPLYLISNPFPFGIGPLTGSTRGLLTLFGTGFAGPAIYHQPDPYMENWNFGLERQLPGDVLVQATYVGNHSLKWAPGENFNQNQLTPAQIHAVVAQYPNGSGGTNFDSPQFENPFFDLVGPGGPYQDPNSPYFFPLASAQLLTSRYPQFPSANLASPPWGNSIYHSFQLRVEKRTSHGLTFLISYTNSKLIDNGEGNFSGNPFIFISGNHGQYQDFTNLKGERSLAANDISQRLALYYIYELPFGRGKRFLSNLNRVAEAFLGGWQTESIFYFSKGVPIVWTESNGDFNRFLAGGRPDKTCNGVKSGSVESRLNAYFDTSCFQTPAAFSVGTAPRTDPHIRWPGARDWDFSLMKNTRVREKYTVQFRAEFFNFTNTPQFAGPGGNFSDSSSFGITTSQANAPREVQFGLRILF